MQTPPTHPPLAPPLDPSPLVSLATAYWGSATLIAAVRLKVFDHLAAGPLTPEQLASDLSASPVAVESLLIALLSLDLVRRDEGERYSNAPLSQAFLVSTQPSSIAGALLYNADVYPLWGQLHEVIERGDTARDPQAYLGDDEGKTRRFVYGMHHRALGVGRAVAGAIDLRGATLLADIGGGPGTYSALLTNATPGLSADVLDLPAVVAVASEIVGQMGASARVRCVAYDYYRDPLPDRPYDAALISGVLHREQPPKVRALFAELAARLPRGGQVWLSDVMLNDERTGPVFSAMFGLNMRVLSHDGRCHSVAELREWLESAGFEVTRVVNLPAPIHYSVIGARRR
jgi:hypothetical protein